ncbi:glucose-6-phosphate isomerase family protein [Desulfitibacter alkalitolerans]|uniref:glucose-6-phosphate isomerase family protein n=1 Tax=Desulfitibacter alkalitolerans TaxID=264641 RepID=UPI00068766F1|nr:glucose-6-phosphate isomerase family protein [Desulfitibacter alkalitolerans]
MIFGTDIILTDRGVLVFTEGIIHPVDPEIRRLKDALQVYYYKTKPSEDPLYYRYENICFQQDEGVFREYSIRYDITVLLSGKIGKEFIKTAGHFHPLKNTGKETYSEYCEVLSGEAIFLLQKNGRNNEVEEVIAIEAKTGDKVYIPSNYGHVTINPGDSFLVVANLIATSVDSSPEPFLEKLGAAYFYVETENGKGDWIKNPAYKNSVGLKIKAAPNIEQPLCEVNDKPIYKAFIDNPQCFAMLSS